MLLAFHQITKTILCKKTYWEKSSTNKNKSKVPTYSPQFSKILKKGIMQKIFQQSSSIFYNHGNKKQYATKFPLPDARIACPVSPRPSSSAASTFIFTLVPSLQCRTIFYFQLSFQFSFQFPLCNVQQFSYSHQFPLCNV